MIFKLLMIMVVLAMAVTVMAAESWVFSDEQEVQIKNAVRAVYPKQQVSISFSENYLNGSLVVCVTPLPSESVQIFIYSGGDVQIIAIGGDEKRTIALAERIKKNIEAVFNRPSLGGSR
jgi:hypothetical protein